MPHDAQADFATTASEPAPHLLVIGGASLDTLHFHGQTVRSAGGAGLYTALAARRAGAEVTMIGPFPDPMPAELESAARVIDWRGEHVPPQLLPSFEIVHREHGASEIVDYAWRAEGKLHPDRLPPDLDGNLVYCCPLCDPALQLKFIRHFHRRGWTTACGTFQEAAQHHPEIVRQTIESTDFFFCNQREAETTFGDLKRVSVAPGKFLFITLGAEGCLVIQGDHISKVRATAVVELDPTGAGDTFCGTVLAQLLAAEHPVRAARVAVTAAAQMVTQVGPAALLRTEAHPAVTEANAIRVDPQRIQAVGTILDKAEEASSFDFVGDDYPPAEHPGTLDFFFAATLQQFGFWTSDGARYERPMVARFEGRDLKGSDFLWAAYRRWLDEDPEGLTPTGQAELERERFDFRLKDDAGTNPLPAAELHLASARRYGNDMSTLGWTPESVIEHARRAPRPLQDFLSQLDHIGGYKEDPLRKKSALLAAILRARPERFLTWGQDEELPPIVDYHVQRSCLRIGLVEVGESDLRRRLEDRRIVRAEEENRIREVVFEALVLMNTQTDKTMADLDWFFFQNRTRCPEMTEPRCGECPIDAACAHRKKLFQPVYRTASY